MGKRKISAEGREQIRLAGFQRFIDSAKARHGDRFGYSKAVESFQTQKDPEVEITCMLHGTVFSVKPFNHIRSSSGGCIWCDKDQMKNFFLDREKTKFEKFFHEELSTRLEIRSDFKGMTEGIDLFCKTHKTITSCKPTFLMSRNGNGCHACARESRGEKGRLTLQDVLEKHSRDLPDHIGIVSVRFNEQERQSEVVARCEIHGDFETTTGYLSRSEHKCPKCGYENIGYAGHKLRRLISKGDRGRPTYIGVMEVEVFGVSSMKVGVTIRTLEERYKWYLRKIFFSARMDEIDAYVLENQIKRKFSDFQDTRIMKAGMRAGSRWSGDTECFRFAAKEAVISFISDFIAFGRVKLDYSVELKTFEIPYTDEIDVSRPKDTSNNPIPVVGIDPKTNLVVVRFCSTSEASRAGFKNVSQIVSGSSERQIAGGLRWFKEAEFDPSSIPPLRTSRRGSPRSVVCLETGEKFDSVSTAERCLRERGVQVSGSHISSVCGGSRKIAGGFHWRYDT
jgi:hypothetical protein